MTSPREPPTLTVTTGGWSSIPELVLALVPASPGSVWAVFGSSVKPGPTGAGLADLHP